MPESISPLISVTYAAYDALTDYFRNDLDVKRDDQNEVVAVSTCDLVGRVIVTGFACALLEVIALVECAIRLAIGVPLFLITLAAICCCSTEKLAVFAGEGAILGLSAPIALIAAQYFNVSKTVMPKAPYITVKVPCTPVSCIMDEEDKRGLDVKYAEQQNELIETTRRRERERNQTVEVTQHRNGRKGQISDEKEPYNYRLNVGIDGKAAAG